MANILTYSATHFHVVFILPSAIGDTACLNKRVIYELLFKAFAEAMLTISTDAKHLGTPHCHHVSATHPGSAITHHPHVHMIVPAAESRMASNGFL